MFDIDDWLFSSGWLQAAANPMQDYSLRETKFQERCKIQVQDPNQLGVRPTVLPPFP